MRLLGSLATCTLLVLAVAFAASAEASTSHWYRTKGTTCLSTTSSRGVPSVSATTRVLMHAGTRLSTKVHFLRLQARLVPTSSGTNWVRGWQKAIFETDPTGETTQLMTVSTKGVDPEKGWKLEIKVVFDRDLATDWRSTLKVRFDTSRCVSPAGQADPSVNGRGLPIGVG